MDIGADVEAAKGFYGPLFGWEAKEAGPPEQSGGYGFFMKSGKLVAGFGPKTNPGPPSWALYFATDDAEATVTKVKEAGGSVMVGPMDVMKAGRMAVLQDPSGAVFSIWQAGDHRGAQLAGEAGAVVWVELNTADTAAATKFYREVFGWAARANEEMAYTQFEVDGEPVAGMMALPSDAPAGHPPYWLVYLGSSDVDATVEAGKGSGAEVLVGPLDIPGIGGRFAVLRDPQGAVFGVFKGPS